MGIILEGEGAANALNDAARHTAIVRLYQDIIFDMQVCEIEGWDKTEYIKMLHSAIDHFAKKLEEKNGENA